ncbi:LysR family transcriptional regulator [Sphingomonas sp. C3-2]|uniref:LysR family transcriptional regulator n=1 Tax=Sphingomonas sp. C3-2 TaxID=3062169 RepID=UPI00294AC28D|nr:LysR substrate-binding domain-containing protein [Sphingomonas sp. C3-2]WOK35497.1 LysR substrate-binding domain-containing protein [Sphingomonas sp. C3-2]
MELRQLRYFAALADAQNFHRAAQRLNMSQPPLTVAIRKLEQELGVDLFVRTPRGVTLTPAGEAVLPHARQTLVQAELVRQAARDGGSGLRGQLRIGFVGSAIYGLIPRIVPEFRKAYPQVNLVLHETTSVEVVKALHAGEFDAGLVRLPIFDEPELETTVLERDVLAVALPHDHPLARRDLIALEELQGEAFIMYPQPSILHAKTLWACHSAGFVPTIAQEAAQVQTILSLIQSRLGIALVPARTAVIAPPDIHIVTLAPQIVIENGLAYLRAGLHPMLRNFRDIALACHDIS